LYGIPKATLRQNIFTVKTLSATYIGIFERCERQRVKSMKCKLSSRHKGDDEDDDDDDDERMNFNVA